MAFVKQHNPEWYKLIKLFKSVDPPYRISTGLTIPFLIGAYKVIGKELSIYELICLIRDAEVDKYPIIQRCHVIGKHVVMVEEKATCNRYFSKFPHVNSESSKGTLLISTNTAIGNTIDRVCHHLQLEYAEPIKGGLYSWSQSAGKWRSFDENEIKLINGIRK